MECSRCLDLKGIATALKGNCRALSEINRACQHDPKCREREMDGYTALCIKILQALTILFDQLPVSDVQCT